jgi:UDP-GlcNAc:undecaprenyl-phosphate/decaprenyl-phosphate GlcNAc-1-phosphate transferase
MQWLVFVIALLASVILVPVVRVVARRLGKVAQPRGDRWHSLPTPYLGGVAIFVAFAIALIFSGRWGSLPLGLLIGAGVAFLVGVIDDFFNLSPQTKLVGLFLAASAVIFSGNITYFFPWLIANIAISFIWMVGIANALNLLDNMDGLSSGTALLVAGFMAYFFWRHGNDDNLVIALAIAGATLGFFIYNFPPASIFMGDGGSLFLGLTLAALAISREDQASNVLAVISVPTLIFLLPILDTAMVAVTRLLRGQSPTQGGRDHTSHRLVSLGLSERQTLLILMGVALFTGLSAVIIESLSYNLSLILIPLVILILTLLSAYLGQLKVVDVDRSQQGNFLTNWMVELTYRRRVLEVVLDFFLIAFAYYLAFLARVGMPLSSYYVARYLQTLPLTVSATFVAFFVFGVYRGVWSFVSIEDAFRIIRANFIGVILTGGLVWGVYGLERHTVWVLFIYFLLLVFLMVASRFSFRLMDRITRPMHASDDMPIFIYGAGAAGELTLRECQQNQNLSYHPLGFIDDDPLKRGRSIHGLDVFGGLPELEQLIDRHGIQGVLITSGSIFESERADRVLEICKRKGVWVRRLRFEFEEFK